MTTGKQAATPEGARRGALLGGLLVASAVFVAFWPALSAEFLNWDDPQNLLQNPHFRGLSGAHLSWMFSTGWLGPYQPLSWLSLGIDHALWGLSGPQTYPEAWGYHLTNVVLHALAAVFAFLAARRLFQRLWPRAAVLWRDWSAVLAALVFAAHPMRAESVVWVTERRDVLSGLFFCASLWAWVGWQPQAERASRRARVLLASGLSVLAAVTVKASIQMHAEGGEPLEALRWGSLGPFGLAAGLGLLAAGGWAAGGPGARRYLIALACFGASLLAKGTGVTLPLALFALDVLLLGRLGAPGERLQRGIDLVLEKMPWFALSALVGLLAIWGQRAQGTAMLGWDEHTLSERLLQCGYGLVWYPWKTLVPTGLVPIVELPPELALDQLRFLLPLILLALSAALLFVTRERSAGVSAALAAFALLVAPVLGLSQAGSQLVADRYGYMPSLPLSFLIAGSLLSLVRWRPQLARPIFAGGLAVGPLLVSLTWRQARVWSTSERLWEHALAVEPESPAAHQFLGVVRRDQGYLAQERELKLARFQEALELFERGYELGGSPRFLLYLRDVRGVLTVIDSEQRELHRAAAVAAARSALEAGVAGAGPTGRLELARYLVSIDAHEEALGELRGLRTSLAGHADVWKLSGLSELESGRPREAREALRQACSLAPEDAGAWSLLGRACEQGRDLQGALEAYERSLALEPGQPTAVGGLRRLGRRR